MKKESKLNQYFTNIADKVSYGMGTPANIMVWIVLVLIWFLLGIFKPDLFINGSFLPAWFVSNSWNFPLNGITTLAELYIGFLVAAAANRNERSAKEQQAQINQIIVHTSQVVDHFEQMEEAQSQLEDKILSLEEKIISLIETQNGK